MIINSTNSYCFNVSQKNCFEHKTMNCRIGDQNAMLVKFSFKNVPKRSYSILHSEILLPIINNFQENSTLVEVYGIAEQVWQNSNCTEISITKTLIRNITFSYSPNLLRINISNFTKKAYNETDLGIYLQIQISNETDQQIIIDNNSTNKIQLDIIYDFFCDPFCHNLGLCVAPNQCDCSTSKGFHGPSCEDFSCNCQHGGVCLAPNLCDCYRTGGYTGETCSDFDCNPPCKQGKICVDLNKCEDANEKQTAIEKESEKIQHT